jgi:hypothetical protein
MRYAAPGDAAARNVGAWGVTSSRDVDASCGNFVNRVSLSRELPGAITCKLAKSFGHATVLPPSKGRHAGVLKNG